MLAVAGLKLTTLDQYLLVGLLCENWGPITHSPSYFEPCIRWLVDTMFLCSMHLSRKWHTVQFLQKASKYSAKMTLQNINLVLYYLYDLIEEFRFRSFIINNCWILPRWNPFHILHCNRKSILLLKVINFKELNLVQIAVFVLETETIHTIKLGII